MKFSIKKTIYILLPLLIGVGLIYFQYTNLTKEQLENIKLYFKNANYNYVLLSFVFSSLAYWARAYRWKYSLNHMGYTTDLKNNIYAVCISYMVNLTIPRSGEVTRAIILKKTENVPFDKAFGTIVAERVVDLLLFLLFIFIGFMVQFSKINEFIFSNISSNKLLFIFGILFLGFFSFLWIWFKSNWSIIKLMKSKFSGLIEGMSSILIMKERWNYLFLSFFIWFCYIMMFYVCIFTIPETSEISFGIVIMGFIFGSVAIGFTNGGIGAFPIAIQTVLLLYGINKGAGAALGWIIWTSQTLFTLILGFSSYLLMYWNKKAK